MKRLLLHLYRRSLARRAGYRLNRSLHGLVLRGLGVLNFESAELSGEACFMRRLARAAPRLVACDVGANVGSYANRLKALAPAATVFAFEPHPRSFAELQEQAALNGFTAVNQALSDAPGELTLYDYDGQPYGTQHASLYQEVIEQTHGAAARAWTVAATTLDAFCDEHEVAAIDLLKIDTEGHELSVLRGARRLLAAGAIGVIHFEFNEMNVVSRVFFRDFYVALPGYRFYRMLPDGLVALGPYNPVTCEIFAYQNIVALRDDYPAEPVLLHG